MAEKYTADAPEQQQYPSPTVHLGTAVEAPTEQAMHHLHEQTTLHMASMQAMMEEMQAAHMRQMQELQMNMQAQMLRLQQQMTGAHGIVHSMEKPSTTERSMDAIKKEATPGADQSKDDDDETTMDIKGCQC